jgi:hypothetical protein
LKTLTASQILYSSQGFPLDVDPDHHSCRICGGDAIAPVVSAKNKPSNSWTDEALIKDPSSNVICAACGWMLDSLKTIWGKMWGESTYVLAASPTRALHYRSYSGLMDVLRSGLEPPYVVMLRRNGTESMHDTQKHIFLRSFGSENYSADGPVRIAYYGNFGCGSGSIYVYPDKFKQDVDAMVELIIPSKLAKVKGSSKEIKARAGELNKKIWSIRCRLTEPYQQLVVLVADSIAWEKTQSEVKAG